MGTYVNGVFVPVTGETGWDDEVNDFLTLSGKRAVNVKAAPYAAKGDNLTDDTAAITSAIADAAASESGVVYFPAGLYKITSTIDLNAYHHLRFVGEGTHVSNAVGGLYGGHAIFNSQSITTGAAFSYDGSVDQQVSGHVWENIVIAAGRTGWRYKDTASVRFLNCGGSVVSDGNADNAVVLVINSFWVQFRDGTYTAAGNALPAVILRGTTATFDVSSTYLVQFHNVRFDFGGVQQEWTAGGGAGSVYMDHCDLESSTRAMLKITGPDPGAPSYLDFIRLRACKQWDQVADAPLIELDATNVILLRPILEDCGQEIGATGIKVTNGGCQMARVTGAPHTQDGAFVVNASGKVIGSIRDRDHGIDYVESQTSESTTDLTSAAGPMFRFADRKSVV